MIFKRPTIPLLIVFVAGLLGFAQDYFSHPLAGKFREEITSWLRIIAGFAMFLGAYSLLHMHFMRIRRHVAGWGYSVFVFIGAAAMIAAGIWNDGAGPLAEDAPSQVTWFTWGYKYVQVPCQTTVFSILAFFMASAAFRSFRARNFPATLLLVSALIVMFGRVTFSETVSQWLFGSSQVFSKAADIIMEYPNTAAQRGILLGISLGIISQSVRILFGIERGYMGGGEK